MGNEQKIREQIAYREGYLAALYLYAWYKEGVMYVGCGRRTYKEIADPIKNKISELREKLL